MNVKFIPGTPLPFRVDPPQGNRHRLTLRDADGHVVLYGATEVRTTRRDMKNAEFLVHAANAYPQLILALHRLTSGADSLRARVEGGKLLAQLGEDL